MVTIGNGEIQYSVLVSSSVNGYEDSLIMIESMLNAWGYDVMMSMRGTLKVNPHLHNFANCLRAVEECDLFLGIIRPDCGTGRGVHDCITFDEFKRARELNKPCWFIIDSKIKHYRNLLKALELREYPVTEDIDLKDFMHSYYDRKVRSREKLPIVQDLYQAKDIHQFDPLCFEMENFVNHKGMARSEIVNNWMQYCDNISDVYRFLEKNLGNAGFIEDVINGNI